MTNIHSLNSLDRFFSRGLKRLFSGWWEFHLISLGGQVMERSLTPLKNLAICSLCVLCLIGAPAVASAEGQITLPTETVQPRSDSAEIAADKVDQFAQAYLQVLQVLSDREPELPAAETSAEALKVQQSIEAEAMERIESSGLTLPEYMQILGLASQDATFRNKVLSRMEESLTE